MRLLVVVVRLVLAVVLALGLAVPVVSYVYARHLVLLGARASSPSVHLPAASLADYQTFAANGAATFVVLRYDDLSTQKASSKAGRTVPVASFAAQLAMLRAAGFSAVSSIQLAAYLSHGTPLPAHAVLIAFDGGRERDWTLADGVLAKYGYSAIVSVDPASVGQRGFLSWTQLSSMIASNRWSIGLDFSGASDSVKLDAQGSTGSALVEHLWLPAAARTETTAEFQARIRARLHSELATFSAHHVPSPQLLDYPFDATYPLNRVTTTFGELAEVVNSTVAAGVLDLAPDTAVSAAYRTERLLPSLQVYSTTNTEELFARIQAAAS